LGVVLLAHNGQRHDRLAHLLFLCIRLLTTEQDRHGTATVLTNGQIKPLHLKGTLIDVFLHTDQCTFLCPLQATTQQQAEDLVSGYQRLTDTGPGGMGGSYLALAITRKGLGTPVGFEQSASGTAAEDST
jgi:hypothetical protein